MYTLLIAVEAGWSERRGLRAYDYPELIANASSGSGQLLTDLWLGALYVVPYKSAFRHFAPSPLRETSVLTWALAICAVDFAFYWQHRVSHRANVLWAAHAVHHQPERYNLGVALRQPWFSVLTNWMYYVPLALLGVPPNVFVTSVAINLAYQFYLHTTLIGHMGPLGEFLNTPSHHRVHHGRNPRYIDKNYGGIFIVWDRLFGTFQREDEAVDYGTTKPFRSRNGVWANFEPWVGLYRRARSLPQPERPAVWLRPPEWRGRTEPPEDDSLAPPPPQVGGWTMAYAAVTLAAAVIASTALIGWQHPPRRAALAVATVIGALATTGALLDRRPYAKLADALRLVATALVVAFCATIA